MCTANSAIGRCAQTFFRRRCAQALHLCSKRPDGSSLQVLTRVPSPFVIKARFAQLARLFSAARNMQPASIRGNGGPLVVFRQPSRQPYHDHMASACTVNKLYGRPGLRHRPRILSKASEAVAIAQPGEQHMHSDSAKLMMQWLASQAGVLQPKVSVDSSQPAAGRRLVATHTLSAGETVLEVPLQRVFADTEVCHWSVNSCMPAHGWSIRPGQSRHVQHMS